MEKTLNKDSKTAIVRSPDPAVAAALLEGKGCEPLAGYGRGVLFRFPIAGGTAILRPYRRGGLIRWFLKDSYFMVNRPRREWDVHVYLYEQGFPVPEPLGVVWERRGSMYRGAIVTRFVDAVDILEYTRLDPANTRRILARAGESICRMHDWGVYHADLQVKNILVRRADDELVFLDFDNAQRHRRLSGTARARNLLRLRRSCLKNGLSLDLFASIQRGYGMPVFPLWLDGLYRVRGLLSGATTAGEQNIPHDDIVVEYVDGMRIRRRAGVPLESVLDAMRKPGEILKTSHKAETLRVGERIVKRSRYEGVLGVLKHTFQRGRYRQGWEAALHLEQRGVPVARAQAFVERVRLGFILGNVLCTDYLDGCVDVEAFADGMIREGVDDIVIQGYLERIAEAVNLLCASGAYHNDLAGKNILTPDGERFYFIDLDGIVLNRPYTDELRLKNHVQLYDSFIDRWDDELLVPFIRQMLPDPQDAAAWMDQVRSAQAVRRARTEAIWQRQGREGG